MERYRNLSGNSGVVAYTIGSDFIQVRFRSGDDYRYSDASAGKPSVDQMKALARAGRGLSTFISRHQPGYEDRPT